MTETTVIYQGVNNSTEADDEIVDVIYTRHARQRMKQRQIEPEQVEETLEMPDEIVPGDNGEEIAVKRYGNREVRVVYEETGADTIVIYTVMKPRVRKRKAGA